LILKGKSCRTVTKLKKKISTTVLGEEVVVRGSAAGQDEALCDGCHQKLAEEDHEEQE
jgi:hypothetical protein